MAITTGPKDFLAGATPVKTDAAPAQADFLANATPVGPPQAASSGGWGPFASTAGMKANPFMERLVADASNDVAQIFSDAAALIASKIAGQSTTQ